MSASPSPCLFNGGRGFCTSIFCYLPSCLKPSVHIRYNKADKVYQYWLAYLRYQWRDDFPEADM